jgi:chromatin assembly factor 1 subunit A
VAQKVKTPDQSGASLSVPSTNITTVKRTYGPPKTGFPETHMPLLLTKITSLCTGNFAFLVESIYQELRVHDVKKNAIEAKIREIGEKSKEKKIWIVKENVMVGSN